MIRTTKALLVALAAALAVGCSGLPPKLDASPAAMTKIRTIAVVRPPEAKTYAVLDLGPHVASAFGLIGALVLASDQNAKQEKLTAALKGQHAVPMSMLADDIAADLAKRGFSAKVIDGGWVENDGEFKFDATKVRSSADAILVVEPRVVGFVLETSDTGFKPTITAVVTLLGNNHQNTLYRGYHACGWNNRFGSKDWKNSSTNVTFADFDRVMEDPKKTASLLNSAAILVAASVAEDLKQ